MPIPNPDNDSISKSHISTTDVSYTDGQYMVFGCPVVSINASAGFNSVAGSMNVSIVEDPINNKTFNAPAIPSVVSISFPSGGIGAPILGDGIDTSVTSFNPSQFHFCGICTGWSETKRDIGGKTITVSIADVRELMGGIQCLLGGFALSQNLTNGELRFADVNNVIDVFGYWDHGMSSDRNEYGLQWSKIKTTLEDIRVSVNDIDMEFVFTGDTFDEVPSWYRVEDEIIDLMSLINKVAFDGGSDIVIIGRKVSDTSLLVEIRGIRRTNRDVLTQSELQNFINTRSDIVESYKLGREFRNEYTSSVIVGGQRNSNYIAWPSEYISNFKTSDASGTLNIDQFPEDIKVRLFGGNYNASSLTSSGIMSSGVTVSLDSGAIFPFWGFMPNSISVPLVEPFLPLSSLNNTVRFQQEFLDNLPKCVVASGFFNVRQVSHQQMFLSNDETSDARPFSYISEVDTDASGISPNVVRGLPLNTEILKAAITSQEAFELVYSTYYPEIATRLKFISASVPSGTTDLRNISAMQFLQYSIVPEKSTTGNTIVNKDYLENAMRQDEFNNILYEAVREYAENHLGRKFIVCLPRSEIMNRIWNGLSVPTRYERPIIEYKINDLGFWENIPPELDGLVDDSLSGIPQYTLITSYDEETPPGYYILDSDGTYFLIQWTGSERKFINVSKDFYLKDDSDNYYVGFGGTVIYQSVGPTANTAIFTLEEEQSIRERFMSEDGRFKAMVVADLYPVGNINVYTHGNTPILLQDFPISDFRPSEIKEDAQHRQKYVFLACSVSQLCDARPDLALVEIPSQIPLDPTDNTWLSDDPLSNYRDDVFLGRLNGIIGLLYTLILKMFSNEELIDMAQNANLSMQEYIRQTAMQWAKELYMFYKNAYHIISNIEFLMDFKAIIIPLTSLWTTYGPWYADSNRAKGRVNIEVDDSLVPWNFVGADDVRQWSTELNQAGEERLARSIAILDYVDSATISVAGFPELSMYTLYGFNSNLTGISIDFGTNGIRSTYNFSTYNARPGTFRKSDYDNISRTIIDTRVPRLPTKNINLSYNAGIFTGTNRLNVY